MNAAHFYGGLNSQKDSILTIGRKRHKCTFELPLTCSEWCMLKHGRKKGEIGFGKAERQRVGNNPKSPTQPSHPRV